MKPNFKIVFAFLISGLLLFSSASANDLPINYRIQVVAWNKIKLEQLQQYVDTIPETLGMNAYIINTGNYYRVLVGDFEERPVAREKLLDVIEYFPDAWIVPAQADDVIYVSLLDPPDPEPAPEPEEVVEEIPIVEEEPELPVEDPMPDPEEVPEPEEVVEEVAEEVEVEPREPAPIPEPERRKLVYPRIYGGLSFKDLYEPLHRDEVSFEGYGFGAGMDFALTRYFGLSLDVDYSFGDAVTDLETHDISGDASVLKVSPALMFGTNFHSSWRLYGKFGASYFNYVYDFRLERREGETGGPSLVDVQMSDRQSHYGLYFGAGIRAFRYLDLGFHMYLDDEERQTHMFTVGLTF